MAADFKPKIIGFLCNWCCYGGADLCGVSRLQYPPYIRVIRLMCSGRVDLTFVLRSFAGGADGVFIGGCHLNDCHYNTHGNYDALVMSHICKGLLTHIGINSERLRLEWVSAGEGIRFAEVMIDFGNKVKSLGPLGVGEGLDLEAMRLKIEAATTIVPFIRLVEREKLRLPTKSEEVYHEFLASDEFKDLLDNTIMSRLAISEIALLLRKRPMPTAEIAKVLGLTPSEVSKHLIASARQGLVRYDQGAKSYALA